MVLIADIFVTIKPSESRDGLTWRSLESLFASTDRAQARFTACIDGKPPSFWSPKFLLDSFDYVLRSSENEGLGPTINRAVAHICSVNDWHSDQRVGDPRRVAPYIVMCQDDLLYSRDWLPVLASRFRAYGMQYPLAFASGVECVEHSVRSVIADGVVLKDWIRAAQMLGTREYWRSLMPIPAFDPETGRLRAKPNDGIGSGVDWWLIRNHENSVCRTGRTCLVMPGLVRHAGYANSTWLARELPESDSDKELIHVQAPDHNIVHRP